MYSNGSNTAQKLESLEKKVGNLQETVSDIQPMKIAATKAVSKGPYISNSVNSTEPLESMVYKEPVPKKTDRITPFSPEEEATSRAGGEWGSYKPYIELDYGVKGKEQEQMGYDMIYNAILAGRPLPSLDDVISAIGARHATQDPAVQIPQRKTAGKAGQRYQETPEELEAALASDRISDRTKSIFDEYTRNIPLDQYGKMQANQGRQRKAYDMIYNAILTGRPVPSQSVVINEIGVTPRLATMKVARPQMNQQYNSGQNQSYMPQQPVSKVPSRPMMQPYNSGENQSYMPQQAQPKMAPLISTYQPPPESSSKDLKIALSLFNKIQSNINNTLFGPLNNLLSSVGEPTISIEAATKKPGTVRLKRGGGQPKCTKKCPGGGINKIVNGKCTCVPRTAKTVTKPSPLAEITATSNGIASQVGALQRGLETISKYLPCKPCEPCESSETSGPTEGGSRVKKSEKTRRNRRS
jgi:hypothetical protein